MFWFKKKEVIRVCGIVERCGMSYSSDGYQFFSLLLQNSDRAESSAIQIVADVRCSIPVCTLSLTQPGDSVECQLNESGGVRMTQKNRDVFRNLTLENRLGQVCKNR